MSLGVIDCVGLRDLGNRAASVVGADLLFVALANTYGDAIRFTLTVIACREQLADELCDGQELAAAVCGVYPAAWVQVRHDPARASAEALIRTAEEHGYTVFGYAVSQRHRLIA